MSNKKLAITIRSLNTESPEFRRLKENFEISYINKSRKRLSEKEVISGIKEADAVLAGTEPFNENVLKSTDTLRVISRVGVGLDNIDLKSAAERKITICNTPNAPTQAVAEHTLALILALYKNIVHYNKDIPGNHQNIISGKLLFGKNAGVIGLGRIGFTVARLLSSLGCNIYYYDPFVSGKDIQKEWICYSSINELLNNSDIVTIHIPPKTDGSAVINDSSIIHFKRGSILINTARSTLIDEKALLDAIDNKIITGAGLDVYDSIIEDQIQNYPQIILTPHVASNTIESREEMEREAIENLIKSIKEIKL